MNLKQIEFIVGPEATQYFCNEHYGVSHSDEYATLSPMDIAAIFFCSGYLAKGNELLESAKKGNQS